MDKLNNLFKKLDQNIEQAKNQSDKVSMPVIIIDDIGKNKLHKLLNTLKTHLSEEKYNLIFKEWVEKFQEEKEVF